MTTFYKYAPRMAELPAAFNEKARAAGFEPAFIDEMLDDYAAAEAHVTNEQQERYVWALRWYSDAFRTYSDEHDPNRTAAAKRKEKIVRDFDALCPSIPNVTAATLEKEMSNHGRNPILLFFYGSPGCSACIPLARTLEALVPEQAIVKMMKINKNTDRDLFDRFWARNGVPLIILFENDSIKAVRMGNAPLEEIRAFIDSIAEPRRQENAHYEAYRKALADAGKAAEPVCVDGVCEVRN